MPADNKKKTKQDDENITKKIQEIMKKMFKEQEDNIKKIITANTKIMNDRLNELNTKIDDIRYSLEFTEKELKNEIVAVKDKQENELKTIKDKLRELEDRSRRNNIRIEGLAESENETWENTSKKVEDLLSNKLRIRQKVTIKTAH